jgi:uncharacterized heparinase superfamily protein
MNKTSENKRATAGGRGGEDRGGGFVRLWQNLSRPLAASQLYRDPLIGRTPGTLGVKIADNWPGDPKRGMAIAAGDVLVGGVLVQSPSSNRFAGAGECYAAWNGFEWLSDLVAAGPAARDSAGGLVQEWLAQKPDMGSIAWHPDVLATRLFAWIAHFDDIVGNQNEDFTRLVLASMSRQYRHLLRIGLSGLAGARRLRALKGLIAGILALGRSKPRLARAITALEREVAEQILPDGGHRSRSPSVQLRVVQDLVDIRSLLRASKIDLPSSLQDAIEKAAPMLRLFRHGDRRLALFNDSLEEDGLLIDLVLTRSETQGRGRNHAPDSGFERLQSAQSIVIVETGAHPPRGFDQDAHAGALSFEMSHGRERIIVNCGAYRGANANWRRPPRATAAHSVLVVADTNSTEIRDDGVRNRAPISVSCERAEHEGQHWISATHDGYRERFGLIYTRELFLAADGDDLRGEDRLTGRPGAKFAVRFHLHPSVEASPVTGETAAALRLPSGARWQLRAAGAELNLGESIYLGSGEARKTRQVVLSGTAAAGGTTVRWALRREHSAAGSN